MGIRTDCFALAANLICTLIHTKTMRLPRSFQLLAAIICLFASRVNGQDADYTLSDRHFEGIDIQALTSKTSKTTKKFEEFTRRFLSQIKKQEQKLKQKIAKSNPALANQLFDGIEERYEDLKKEPGEIIHHSQVYSGHLDSLTTALAFLKEINRESTELANALSQFSSLQDKFSQAEKIRSFLSERKRLLRENLEKLGMPTALKGFQKRVYYYAAQVNEYKSLWKDPSKLEKKLLEILSRTEAFKDFFRQHSQLASLFALPGNNTAAASLAGLQTRVSVQQGIQDRFGAGLQIEQLLQQNLQAGQGQLDELKSKLARYGQGSYGNTGSDVDLPDGFKPNNQKTKTFFQRLEYGVNIQSQKARSYFPTTSDIGLSLGYKLSDNSSIGVGASYTVGWGRGWEHIRITSEGVGLRSYVDMRLKGNLYISGGYEQNYRSAFENVGQLRELDAWQKSGLLGLSKRYKVSKKIKGDIKLLWDFLSYQQIPRTQAVLFRIGYSLK